VIRVDVDGVVGTASAAHVAEALKAMAARLRAQAIDGARRGFEQQANGGRRVFVQGDC
jgi:hypothetical protein